MIKRGDYKVFSVEVVKCLEGLPGLLETTVVGVPCPVLEERVHALVQISPGAGGKAGLAAAIADLCCRNMADCKVAETLKLTLLPLPRNASSKPLKRELRAQLARPRCALLGGPADGQAINAQGRLANADRHALAFLATGAHTAVQPHVVSHHGDAGQ